MNSSNFNKTFKGLEESIKNSDDSRKRKIDFLEDQNKEEQKNERPVPIKRPKNRNIFIY